RVPNAVSYPGLSAPSRPAFCAASWMPYAQSRPISSRALRARHGYSTGPRSPNRSARSRAMSGAWVLTIRPVHPSLSAGAAAGPGAERGDGGAVGGGRHGGRSGGGGHVGSLGSGRVKAVGVRTPGAAYGGDRHGGGGNSGRHGRHRHGTARQGAQNRQKGPSV